MRIFYGKYPWKSRIKDFWADKPVSLSEIIWLTLGYGLFLGMYQFNSYQNSFDQKISRQVYRCYVEEYSNGELERIKGTVWLPLGKEIKETIPGIKHYVNMYDYGITNCVIYNEDKAAYFEPYVISADPAIIPVFSLQLIRGDSTGQAGQCLISEHIAKKYFGEENPVGKTLHWRTLFFKRRAKIAGVFKDRGSATHLRFDVIFFSMNRLHFGRRFYDNWEYRLSIFPTYLELEEGVSATAVEKKISNIVNTKVISPGQEKRSAIVKLQRVQDIHLNASHFDYEQGKGIDKQTLSHFNTCVYILLLLICINYLYSFYLEFGIRFPSADPEKMISEMLLKNFLWISVSFTLAIVLNWVLQAVVRDMLNIPVDFSLLTEPNFYIFLAGVYCLHVLAFSVLMYLLGISLNAHQLFRLLPPWINSFIICLNVLGIFTIVSVWIGLSGQARYVQNKDLGLNTKEILLFNSPFSFETLFQSSSPAETMTSMREELIQHPQIIDIANTIQIPAYAIETKVDARIEGQALDQATTFDTYTADQYFFHTHDIKFLAGSTFTRLEGLVNTEEIIINEYMANRLGFQQPEDAIGQQLIWDYPKNIRSEIIGVIADIHHKSLHNPVRGTLYIYGGFLGPQYSIRYPEGSRNEVIDLLKRSWEKYFPDEPLKYFDLDAYLKKKSYSNFLKQRTTLLWLCIWMGIVCFFSLIRFSRPGYTPFTTGPINQSVGGSPYTRPGIGMLVAAGITGMVSGRFMEAYLLRDFEYKIQAIFRYESLYLLILILFFLGIFRFISGKKSIPNRQQIPTE